jgi:hypothetical protein
MSRISRARRIRRQLLQSQNTVKPWFMGRPPFQLQHPGCRGLASRYPPSRAQISATSNGQPAALLLFTIHKHEVSIFLMQRSTSPASLSTLSGTRAGFTLDTAATRDLRIVAVAT